MRASRIPKVDTIPVQHLVYIAQEWLFDGDNWNRSSFHFLTVVKSGAKRGSEECAWLLEKFENIGDFPSYSKVERMFDDSPRSKYYIARLCQTTTDPR